MSISNPNRLVALATVAAALFITGCGGGSIKNVKKGYSPAYPDVTIEGGYKFALKGPKWKEFKTEKGQRVVEVTGEVKKEDLRNYVLGKFYDSDIALTDEERDFWEKYPFIHAYLPSRRPKFIEEKPTAELAGLVREELLDINREHWDALNSYKNTEGRAKQRLSSLFSYLKMDSEGELPELEKRLSSIKSQIPLLTGNEKHAYDEYRRAKASNDGIADKVRAAQAYVQELQAALEKDHAKAQKARFKFLKSFFKKSDPIITAQFVMHVDGESFASGAVTARLDGGPWDDKELTLDTTEWESLIFSD